MRRAWCVFEMAAFMKAHGEDAKLVIRPTFFGPCSVASVAGLAGVLVVNVTTFYFTNGYIAVVATAAANLRLALLLLSVTSFMFAAVSSFRRYYASVEEMQMQLKDFAIEDTLTYCCTRNHRDESGNPIPICDRQIIVDCIVAWFGSTDAFNQRVRERMQAALVPKLGHLSFSYSWMVACCIPYLWASMAPVFLNALVEDWSYSADSALRIIAWWLGGFPIMGLSVLAVSKVTSRQCSRCISFLVNLLASWIIMPIYIGIELWITMLEHTYPFPTGQALYVGSLLAVAHCFAVFHRSLCEATAAFFSSVQKGDLPLRDVADRNFASSSFALLFALPGLELIANASIKRQTTSSAVEPQPKRHKCHQCKLGDSCNPENAEVGVEFLQRKLSLAPRRPHVLLFVADDVGWAGLGVHRTARNTAEAQGKAETQTPNLDALVRQGVLLERHYTSSTSAPSRSSLLSGRLPRRFPQVPEGISTPQMFWNPQDNVSGFYGIPRNMTGIGRKMKEAGYATHFIGKWDVGFATPEHAPLGRGFDSFLGNLQSMNDYWSKDHAGEKWLLDTCLNNFQDFSLHNATYRGGVEGAVAAELGCGERVKGKSFTDIGCNKDDRKECLPESCFEESMFLEYATKLLKDHEPSTPLFLVYSSHLVHVPLQTTRSALKLEEAVQGVLAKAGLERKFAWTKRRRALAANLMYLDGVMGRLVDALKERQMFEDTLIIFISDNGGSVHLRGGGNNYPLKSGKAADFEGGVRTNAFISGGFVPAEHRGSTFHGVIHIADWYATLCDLAGVSHFDQAAADANKVQRVKNLPLLGDVDGRPQMQHILSGSNGRPDALHLSRHAVLKWPYKLVTGEQEFSFWPGPVFPNCSSVHPEFPRVDVFGHGVRIEADDSTYREYAMVEDCGTGCLYDIEADPGEHANLANQARYQAVLTDLQEELERLNKDASTAALAKSLRWGL
ncbi:Arsb [Symbiodinium sp. CCMP2592]|nr:Arsb [Symbiodinium sp. CCMP2592]